MFFKSLLIIFVSLKCAENANILGIFPMPATSHYILNSKLMKGLVSAGHDVTMISPYKLKDPPKNGKYTDVILEGAKGEFDKLLHRLNLLEIDLLNPLTKMTIYTDRFLDSMNNTIYHPNVQKLLHSNKKFDVVIIEQFFNEALRVFPNIYNCPLIILSSLGPNSIINPSVGTPQPVSYVPNVYFTDFSRNYTFLYRATNLMFYILHYFVTNFYIIPKHNELIHHAFPDAPSLYDLYSNVSLVLFNSHTSINDAVPVVPNMIEIGGYFIDEPQKLHQDLQDFLDSAKEGAIYFSMGSNLKSKDFPDNKKKAILNVFGGLKQKVLWKFEEDLPGKPANVMIRKWFPQQDILAHPNIKLFITHGGLLSTTETIHHGIPILAIPVFDDQFLNAAGAVAKGYGVQLGYHDPDFTEEKFGAILNEVLNNPKYRENARLRSRIYHDRPQKPMETAVYWVEYIIRHKGAPHLRVAGVGMSWYKYFMIDVIAVILLSILVIFYSIKLLVKKLFYNGGKTSKSLKKQKTN